jgi:hypothetical protein
MGNCQASDNVKNEGGTFSVITTQLGSALPPDGGPAIWELDGNSHGGLHCLAELPPQ